MHLFSSMRTASVSNRIIFIRAATISLIISVIVANLSCVNSSDANTIGRNSSAATASLWLHSISMPHVIKGLGITRTAWPTMQPIIQPTGQPTRQPTSQPTRLPTRQPSGQPTRQPSGQPTRLRAVTTGSTPSLSINISITNCASCLYHLSHVTRRDVSIFQKFQKFKSVFDRCRKQSTNVDILKSDGKVTVSRRFSLFAFFDIFRIWAV